MDTEKISKIIKEIRQKNNLTQKDFADKYNVTYQAVSKWENGKNLPDITLLRNICNDFNINISEVFDLDKSKQNKKYLLVIIPILIILILCFIIIKNNQSNTFQFKTISSSCSDFEVSGSIAYDNKKSAIYISNINYCGVEDKNIYDRVECSLYETDNNINIKITSCENMENMTLEEYLKHISLNIDNHQKMCQSYNDNSLFLEINAYSNDNIKTYKVPLSIDKNCK